MKILRFLICLLVLCAATMRNTLADDDKIKEQNVLPKDVAKDEYAKIGFPADTQPGFLDPAYIDNMFYDHVGKKVESITGGKRLAVEKIPYWDDAFDQAGKYSPVGFEVGNSVVNKYVWRGQNLGNRLNLQPYAKATPKFIPFGTINFTWWANFLNGGNVTKDTEHDFVFDYNFDLPALLKLTGVDSGKFPYLARKILDFNYDTGITHYYFPPNRSQSNEYYNTFTFNWPLHPYLSLVNDYGAGNGMWIEWGGCESWDFKAFVINSYAKFGYNKKQWCNSSKLQTFEYGFSLPIPIGKHTKVEPFLAHSVRLNKTYFYTTDDDGNSVGNVLTQNEFYGGVKYSISF